MIDFRARPPRARYAVPAALVLAGLLAPAVLHAQVPVVERPDLPRAAAEEVVAFFNAPGTVRLQGRVEVPAGREIRGDVAVLRGPVEIGGTIRGSLVVINGDLTLLAGAEVEGDVIVLGGGIEAAAGTVAGGAASYEEALRYTARGERIALDEGPRGQAGLELRGPRTGARLSVRVEESYNRVEGLPVLFGGVWETQARNFTRLDAMGIWRTDRGLSGDELGWSFRFEQHLAGRFAVGGTAHSRVTPVERWHLQDVEASLATFLFHRDYRDHFEREGFSAFFRWTDVFSGLALGLEYRDEEHAFVPVGSPWTLQRNEEPWRPQPLVGEGRLRSLHLQVELDDRNDPEDATDGWYLRAEAGLGMGGGLTLPAHLPEDPLDAGAGADPEALGSAFHSTFLDVRRYARLSPSSHLRLRGVVAGSLDGDPLPPHLQRALGGEGTLPGYPLFRADCGARDTRRALVRQRDGESERIPVFPAYGCDRISLFQIEYRHDFSLGLDLGPDDEWDEEWHWYPVVDFSPSLAVFADVGRGWTLEGEGEGVRADTPTLADVGVGLYLGDLGLHWAWPLHDGSRSVNFYLRIDHRF